MKEKKMKNRVAGIIYKDDYVLLVHREKGYGSEKMIYNVIPGGGVEENETLEEALRREILEEVGIEIEILNLENPFILEEDERKQYFYYCRYKSGTIGKGIGEEMKNDDYENKGSYKIIEVRKNEIKNMDIRPTEIDIQEKILEGYKII